jgi:hypothetical protein
MTTNHLATTREIATLLRYTETLYRQAEFVYNFLAAYGAGDAAMPERKDLADLARALEKALAPFAGWD